MRINLLRRGTLGPCGDRVPWERRASRGMTLIELLVVLIIIGLMAVVISGKLFGKADIAKARLNAMKMKKLQQALENYNLEYNSYPPSLQSLVNPPKKGGFAMKLADTDDLEDIWGAPYTYTADSKGRGYTLKSLGADKAPGGDDENQDVTLKPGDN